MTQQKKVFTLEFLEERVKACFALAKIFLEKGEEVAPVLILGHMEMGEAPRTLDMSSPEAKELESLRVQTTIRTVKPTPQYGITIMDAFMLRLENVSEEDRANFSKNYKQGSIAKDPRRVEVLTVIGMSVLGSFSIIQPYHRRDGKIEYEEPVMEKSGELTLESALFGDVWLEVAKAKSTVH